MPKLDEARAKLLGALGGAFREAGRAFARLRAPLREAPLDEVPVILAKGMGAAAHALERVNQLLSEAEANGIALNVDAAAGLAQLGPSLGEAAEMLAGGDNQAAARSLRRFADQTGLLLHPDSFQGEGSKVRMAMRRAAIAAGQMAAMAELLADVTGEQGAVARLRDAAALAFDPERLQAETEALLAVRNGRLRRLLGLTAAARRRVAQMPELAQHPDVMKFCAFATEAPAMAANALAIGGCAGAAIRLGAALEGVARILLLAGIGAFFSCPNDCSSAGARRNCKLGAQGVSSNGRTPGNDEQLQLAMTLIKYAPAGNNPVGMAAKIPVANGVGGLLRFMNATRPQIWVKVQYEQCTSVMCWLFWSRLTWRAALSDWQQVTVSPLGLTDPLGVWPPVAQWTTPAIAADILAALNNKVNEFCA